MFTLDQIHAAHQKVKSGADFPQYVQDLKTIGVTYYETYVADGRATFHGAENFSIGSEPKYPAIPINPNSSSEKLKHAIAIHQQGATDYPTFCMQAAEAGVEKWVTHAIVMTVTYLDLQGNKLAVEPIPQP